MQNVYFAMQLGAVDSLGPGTLKNVYGKYMLHCKKKKKDNCFFRFL